MKAPWLTAFGLTVAATAWAQRPPIQAQMLPPLQQQDPPSSIPRQPESPVGSQLPDAPAGSGQANQNRTQSGQSTPEQPNIWLPGKTAQLLALDKVNAQATALTIKVGQSATFGSLTITVKACLIRSPDQPVDAAAFLDVTDSHPDAAGFKGWMLATEPSVSIMQHPIYDLRVTGCV